jgi:choline dehydrogenase
MSLFKWSSFFVVLSGILYLIFSRPTNLLNTDETFVESHYDYIIVGSGSAGAVLASRLRLLFFVQTHLQSEDPNSTILLLEAGDPDELEAISIPLASLTLYRSSASWNYFTTVQVKSHSRHVHLPEKFSPRFRKSGRNVISKLSRKTSHWPRGKTLGGSSSINAMMYVRGNKEDYDQWNLSNWTYEKVLPYFIKSENNQRPSLRFFAFDG